MPGWKRLVEARMSQPAIDDHFTFLHVKRLWMCRLTGKLMITSGSCVLKYWDVQVDREAALTFADCWVAGRCMLLLFQKKFHFVRLWTSVQACLGSSCEGYCWNGHRTCNSSLSHNLSTTLTTAHGTVMGGSSGGLGTVNLHSVFIHMVLHCLQ
jgi:hypothetical protein